MNKLVLIISFLAALKASAADLKFPGTEEFFFGVSNAPSQVEDNLDDIWMQFAREGHIPAFPNYSRAEERISFWSDPESEIKLAKTSDAEVFRFSCV